MPNKRKLLRLLAVAGLVFITALVVIIACDNRRAIDAAVSVDANITLTIDPSSIVMYSSTNPDTIELSIRVRDANGSGIDSVEVNIYRSPNIGTIIAPEITLSGGYTSAYYITDPEATSDDDSLITFIALVGSSADTSLLEITVAKPTVSMSLSPENLTIYSLTKPDTVEIDIRVRDLYGNGIDSIEVEMSRYPAIGTIISPYATSMGGYTTAYFITDPGYPEDSLVTFIASTGTSVDTSYLSVSMALPTLTMSLIPSALTISSSNKPDTVEINIRVRDGDGNGIDSVEIEMSRTPETGTIVPPEVTSMGGYTSAYYITDPGITEDMQVFITAQSASAIDIDTLDVVVSLQGEIDTMNISLGSQSIVANGEQTVKIYVSVIDTTGVPIGDGMVVRMENYGATAGGILDSSYTKTEGGIATFTLTAPPYIDTLRVVDMDTLHAYAESESGTISHAYATITYIPDDPAVLDIVTIPEDMLAGSGDDQEILVRVSDAQGSFVNNGTQVRFDNELTTSSITTLTTTVAGYATGIYTVGTESGIDIIRAFYTEPGNDDTLWSDAIPITIRSSVPTNIELSTSDQSIELGGASTMIYATMQDENNNPLSDGYEIRFEITSAPGVENDTLLLPPSFSYVPTVDSILQVITAVTDVNGRASIALFSGTAAGTVRIKATSVDNENIFKEKSLIVIQSGPPYIIDIMPSNSADASDDGQSIMTGVTAAVWDRYTNAVEPGTAIHFRVIPIDIAYILGDAYTGGGVDENGDTVGTLGQASTTMYYSCDNTFDTIRVVCSSGDMADTSGPIVLAIGGGQIIVSANPSLLYVEEDSLAESVITAYLIDALSCPIHNGRVQFSIAGCGGISPNASNIDTTNTYGNAYTIFRIYNNQLYLDPDTGIKYCNAVVGATLLGYPDVSGEIDIYCQEPL